MVRVRTRRCRRDNKMTDFNRQSDWTRHLNRSKSIRLRNGGPSTSELPVNLCESPSINYNRHNRHRRQPLPLPQQAAHLQQQQQQRARSGRHSVANNATTITRTPTTSGNQLTISSTTGRNEPKESMAATKIMKPPRAAAAMSIRFCVVVLITVCANELLLCNCDMSVEARGKAIPKSTASSKSSLFATAAPASASKQNLQARRLDAGSSLSAPFSESRAPMSHKERLLMSLTDNIERQHVKLNPSIRSFALARPSKFDSGSERLQEAPSNFAVARIRTRASSSPSKQSVKTLDDIMSQHYQQAAGNWGKSSLSLAASSSNAAATATLAANPAPAGSQPGSKADLDLRQIMLLHERAAAAAAALSRTQTTGRPASSPGGSLSQKLFAKLKPTNGIPPFANETLARPSNGVNRLLSLAAQPLKGDAVKAGRVLSDVVSYLSPMAASSSKLLPSPLNLTNPFTARTSAKTFLVAPLLGFGQMLASLDGSPKTAAGKHSLPPMGGPENQMNYVLSNAVNQPHGYSNSLKGNKHSPDDHQEEDLMAESSAVSSSSAPTSGQALPAKTKPGTVPRRQASSVGGWIRNSANQLTQSYFQDSFRDLLTLTQLPILSAGPASTAPSELEPGGKKYTALKLLNQQVTTSITTNKGNRTQAIDDAFRYAYILGNLGARRKRDPLKALGSAPSSNSLILASQVGKNPFLSLRGHLGHHHAQNHGHHHNSAPLRLPSLNLNALLANRKQIKPRGVMWDMATDPSLAVTVFHLLERASVALPLGFLLMPFVHMIRNPLNGINLGRIIPARASHRSVDYEELAKKIEMMDKILSRSLRPSHRESGSLSFIKR